MSPKESLVSVIVLNWNGNRFLSDCLGSLLSQDYPNYEVLLVDNGSTDGSVESVKKEFGKNANLKIVALKENYGFSKGNNIGISRAQGKYVIILNNDTIVKENFITKLMEIAENECQIGSVGCKILSQEGDVWLSQKFMNMGFIVPFLLQTLVEDRIETITNNYATNLANAGCAVLYRKSVLNEIGSFDEDFWSNWEDWDLGYRINLAGFKSVYIPLPLVTHVCGGSEGFLPLRYVRIYRNMLFTYFKNYETRNLLIRFPILLFILLPIHHFGWTLNRLFSRQARGFCRWQALQYSLSMIRGLLEFLINLRTFSKKRIMIQGLRKVADSKIFLRTQMRSVC